MIWQHLSVKIFSACSSDGHPVNVLELLQACEGTASECEGITCGTVVSTTAQNLSVADCYNVEQTPGGCTDVYAGPMVHHSYNSSRPEGNLDACLAIDILGRANRLSRSKQHGHPRSTGESTVEDQSLTMVVQPHSKDVEGTSPHVLEEGTTQ